MDIREIEEWYDLAEEKRIMDEAKQLHFQDLQSADYDTRRGERMKLQLQMHNLYEREQIREKKNNPGGKK